MRPEWLHLQPGETPLIVSIPHAGTRIVPEVEARLISPWLARKDADWRLEMLYAFAAELGATIVRTEISRSVIDVNRDPSGASLYPGQATTGLCPAETFDGEALYAPGDAPDDAEIESRRTAYFQPYHDALSAEIQRLRGRHPRVVLYDAHAIRSRIPRLFEGVLPEMNLGSNSGQSCAPALTEGLAAVCAASGRSYVINGRFKGGWTTRRYGQPEMDVHAVQMELGCRAYMDDPETVGPDNWPSSYDADRAAPLRATLRRILDACITFAKS